MFGVNFLRVNKVRNVILYYRNNSKVENGHFVHTHTDALDAYCFSIMFDYIMNSNFQITRLATQTQKSRNYILRITLSQLTK